jgi:hypothetical protein
MNTAAMLEKSSRFRLFGIECSFLAALMVLNASPVCSANHRAGIRFSIGTVTSRHSSKLGCSKT